MKFKAILRGIPRLPRPIECYGPTEEALKVWIDMTLKSYPEGRVLVYEIRDVIVAIYSRDGEGVIRSDFKTTPGVS